MDWEQKESKRRTALSQGPKDEGVISVRESERPFAPNLQVQLKAPESERNLEVGQEPEAQLS